MLVIHTKKITNDYDYRKWHWLVMRSIKPELEYWKYKLFLKFLTRKYKNSYLIDKCIYRIKKDYPNKVIVTKDIAKDEYYWFINPDAKVKPLIIWLIDGKIYGFRQT